MAKFRVGLLGVVLLFTNALKAVEIAPEQYGFPLKDAYLATILSRATPPHADFKTLELDLRPERNKIPGLEEKNKIPVALFIHDQDPSAPLVYVIAGTGGNATSAIVIEIANQIYKMGFNAVTLPDPLSQEFILGYSELALPGYPPRDTIEYYEFLKKVTKALKRNTNINVNQPTLVGYSYGAILTGFLMKNDLHEKEFNFSKAVMINPALDLTYGVKVLDNFFLTDSTLKFSRSLYVELSLAEMYELVLHGVDRSEIVERFNKKNITDLEMQGMIGLAFRDKLTKIVFASQQVNDLGLLKTKNINAHRARKHEAADISFDQYMNEFVLPSLTAPDFNISDGNIYALTDLLKSDSRIYVVENADDILVNTGDLDYLRTNLKERLYLYPYGGHVGNAGYSQNRHDLEHILKN